MKTPPVVRNVTATCRQQNPERIALACEYKGFRYHVWMSPRTETVDTGVIYKNPLDEGTKRTLKLNADTRPMQALIEAMLDVYRRDDLLGKLEETEAQEKIKLKDQVQEHKRKQAIQNAALDLYEACKDARAAIWKSEPIAVVGRILIAAIKKAERI